MKDHRIRWFTYPGKRRHGRQRAARQPQRRRSPRGQAHRGSPPRQGHHPGRDGRTSALRDQELPADRVRPERHDQDADPHCKPSGRHRDRSRSTAPAAQTQEGSPGANAAALTPDSPAHPLRPISAAHLPRFALFPSRPPLSCRRGFRLAMRRARQRGECLRCKRPGRVRRSYRPAASRRSWVTYMTRVATARHALLWDR